MEVASGGLVEDELGEGGGGLRGGRADGPEDDVQLRRRCRGGEMRRFFEALVEFEGGGVPGFEALRECAAGCVGEQLLRGPESDRRGGGAGFGGEVCGEGEVATVGGIDVDAEFVSLLEGDDPVERIYGADGGGA